MAKEIPVGLEELDRLLVAGEVWAHGPLESMHAVRIGEGFGLSGRVYRVQVRTPTGDASLVVKAEPADKIERALAFRRENETRLAGSIPALLGASREGPDGHGVLVLEDVSPATQGDELEPCQPEHARALIGVIARLHATTWRGAGSSDGWGRSPWEPGRWQDRLTRAGERYPAQFDDAMRRRLARFDLEAEEAATILATRPASWIHGDPHLDNVLWRPGGSAVVLDWSTASIGPPGFDLAVLLVSLSMRDEPSLTPEDTIETYADTVSRHGTVGLSNAAATDMARVSLPQLILGMVGFVGFPTDQAEPRARRLRDHAAVAVCRALAWIDR